SIRERLRNIPKMEVKPNHGTYEYFIAGGTDIYVQSGERLSDSSVEVLNLHPEMKGINRRNGSLHLGALTTFEEFADAPEVQKVIPAIKKYMHLNASWQIRNRATLGGNIVNASPIGDMTILFIALKADLVLTNGKNRRTVPIQSFFKGYKDLAKTPDEILSEIVFPIPHPETKVHFEKVSKRKTLDIASVNSAIRIRSVENIITEVDLSMGGVAPIPLYLNNACEYLRGQRIDKETVLETIQRALAEISPISDVRGSVEYKRLLVRQLTIAHFTKLFPKYLRVSDFYEAS
ncbi:FAD binding domain-containing protein, partial [bacterium]|nr:FAD binding domain-containing protein [bacterium]